jgi:hypothetical protein
MFVTAAADTFEELKSAVKLVPEEGVVPVTSPSEVFDALVRVTLNALLGHLPAPVSRPFTVTIPTLYAGIDES